MAPSGAARAEPSAELSAAIEATHDLDVVDGLLSEVIFLQGGKRVAAPASPGTLRDRYREAMHAS